MTARSATFMRGDTEVMVPLTMVPFLSSNVTVSLWMDRPKPAIDPLITVKKSASCNSARIVVGRLSADEAFRLESTHSDEGVSSLPPHRAGNSRSACGCRSAWQPLGPTQMGGPCCPARHVTNNALTRLWAGLNYLVAFGIALQRRRSRSFGWRSGRQAFRACGEWRRNLC